jgi:tRNA uridine 5-carbamoylmethylation protein Kti12
MGIAKVAETREKVGEISLELEKKKILVAQLQRECEEFLEKIVEQKNSASERERVGDFLKYSINQKYSIASTSIWCSYW